MSYWPLDDHAQGCRIANGDVIDDTSAAFHLEKSVRRTAKLVWTRMKAEAHVRLDHSIISICNPSGEAVILLDEKYR